jgi:succinate dehydrogenase/fumarate reductase flavoprotein subunit
MISTSTIQCDIAIAGGALAGLSAALFAAGRGRKVIVLEAGQRTGGTALFSGGAIHIEGSRNWEEYRKLVPLADPVLGKVLAERYPEFIQWLASTGAPGRVGELIYRDRSFFGFQMGGTSMPVGKLKFFDFLHRRVEQLGGKVLLGTRGTRLIVENGRVTGIVAQQGDLPGGREITIKAKSVVLATGGFQANPELVQKFISRAPEHATQRAISADRGDGLQMALEVGAKLCDRMDTVYGHLLPAPPCRIDWSHGGSYLDPMLMSSFYAKHAIVVNSNGERFADEGPGETNAVLANEACRQPPGGLWVIMDHTIRRDFARYEIPRDAMKRLSSLRHIAFARYLGLLRARYASGEKLVVGLDSLRLARDRGAVVVEAGSVDDLAAQLGRHGVNGDGLRRTLAEFNARVANGAAMGLPIPKTKLAYRIEKPPFHAIKVAAGISLTHGGVAINTKAQVLDQNDAPIPGLYAAPGTAGGIHHMYYGGSHSTCGVFGMIAGESASAPG